MGVYNVHGGHNFIVPGAKGCLLYTSIFSNAVSGLATIFKAPINAIVDGWNGLAGSLGSVTIPDWVPGIGGGSWSLPKMHRMKIGMDYVPYDCLLYTSRCV